MMPRLVSNADMGSSRRQMFARTHAGLALLKKWKTVETDDWKRTIFSLFKIAGQLHRNYPLIAKHLIKKYLS